MSVDRTDYIIIGYKMPYDVKFKSGQKLNNLIWEDDKYLPLIEGWVSEDFRLISDGMSCNYIAFGLEIASSDKYLGFEFIEFEINTGDFDHVRSRAIELFSDFDFDFSQPKALIFSHYG